MKTELYKKIKKLNPNKENYVLTLLEGEGFGEKAVVSDHMIEWMSAPDGFFHEHAVQSAKVSESGIIRIEDRKIFAERIGQEKKLIVCGAGHVSIPIIKIGKMIGFAVTCVDDRPFFADRAREAGADTVICDDFINALNSISGDEDTYFVIVTRGHRWDEECLREIAGKSHAYIGMMGSRRRVKIVKEKLFEEGIPREILDSIFSPIGLNIHAETPEEIAVSVMAEIVSVNNQRRIDTGYPKEILDAIINNNSDESFGEGEMILSTIVEKKGPAPREIGTKMLILPDGRCIGTIGGGCVEADVMRKGREMLLIEESVPVLQNINLTNDEASEEGMTCGGIISVLMEPIEKTV
ncbi:MAG: XdhC family protein [Eubacterium sp.]|nr:XdhC family protein [Eubacterium sp.]